MMTEVRSIIHDGQTYTPIFRNDQMLNDDELGQLAIIELSDQPIRRFSCVLATSEQPRSDNPPLDIRNGKFDIP